MQAQAEYVVLNRQGTKGAKALERSLYSLPAGG
jgi:hypothetical protein